MLNEWADKNGLEGSLENLKAELEAKSHETFASIVADKALEGSDEFFEASLNLAEFYKNSGQPEAGLHVLEQAFAIYGSQTRAYRLLKLKGELTYKLNQLDETIHTYEDLISLLTTALEDKVGSKEAEVDEYLSTISEAYLALGYMLYAQDKFGEALYLYLEGIERMPQSDRKPWPFYQIANCYNRLNNYEKANFYYEKVREEFPDNFWSEYIGWNQDRMQWEQNFKKA